MKRIAIALTASALLLSACVQPTPTQSTIIGATSGAALGAAVSSKQDRTQGALLGAAVGAIASTQVGPSRHGHTRNQCYYSDGKGGSYVAAC